MSLGWNIENCTEEPDVLWDDDNKHITNFMIWETITVGMGKITEDNWTEFYARMRFLEDRDGPFWYKMEEGEGEAQNYYTKPEMVKRYIGLSTNVTEESRTEFLERHAMKVMDRYKRKAERWEEENA